MQQRYSKADIAALKRQASAISHNTGKPYDKCLDIVARKQNFVSWSRLIQTNSATPTCVVCHAEMLVRHGKFGAFWACPKSYKGNDHGTINIGAQVAADDYDHCSEREKDRLAEMDGWQ